MERNQFLGPTVRPLNKIDEPYLLEIKEDEGFLHLYKVERVHELHLKKNPDESMTDSDNFEEYIKEQMEIKGSLPYEIRDWAYGNGWID